jgi:uncharacterized membrane protein (UPF0182 family)
VLQSQQINGPVQADSAMQQDRNVSQEITLLDKPGTEVLLGNTLMIPIDQAILYVRPMYVAATSNPIPTLSYVIAMLGNINSPVAFQTSLQAAISQALNTAVPVGGSTATTPTEGSSGSVSSTVAAEVANLLKQAQTDYQSAQQALENGDLATYQSDIQSAQKAVAEAAALIPSSGGTSSSSTTTTTTAPRTTTTTAPKTSSTKGAATSTGRTGGAETSSSTAGASSGGSTTTTAPGEA